MPRAPEGPIELRDLPPPTLVEDQRAMDALTLRLQDVEEIAVDTEADSFFHYREQVCLIQVSAEGEDYLIDPLAGFDLGGLGEMLADPRRTKIFHDGEYDVLIMKRSYGFEFAGLYDTRVAAAALGVESPGLASVLSNRFGLELDKSMQRSDWSRRPLSPQQIAYARLDTRFLIPLMHEQLSELDARNRRRIVEGECRRLEALEVSERQFNPDEFQRIKGSRDLNPEGKQALRELFIARDRIAEQRDQPPFKVLPNHVMLELASRRPKTRDQLYQTPGAPARQLRRLERDLLLALDRAREQGPLTKVARLPSKDGTGELNDEQTELHDRLRDWRRKVAKDQEIDAALILNRHVLLRLATERPHTRAEIAALDGFQDWQVDLFADPILKVVERMERELASGDLVLPRRRSKRRE